MMINPRNESNLLDVRPPRNEIYQYLPHIIEQVTVDQMQSMILQLLKTANFYHSHPQHVVDDVHFEQRKKTRQSHQEGQDDDLVELSPINGFCGKFGFFDDNPCGISGRFPARPAPNHGVLAS